MLLAATKRRLVTSTIENSKKRSRQIEQALLLAGGGRHPINLEFNVFGFQPQISGSGSDLGVGGQILRVFPAMDNLPAEICHKIFCLLDHQHLATALQVCRNWNNIAVQDELWRNLFIQRWGTDHANFFSPLHPKTWKMTYETQDRCDRVGLGLTITSEGYDYYIVYQGEIQYWLGSKKTENNKDGISDMKTVDGHHSSPNDDSKIEKENAEILPTEKGPCPGLFDKILFFVGDLEKTSRQVKRKRII